MVSLMLENKTKAKLAAGEAVFGCFVRYAEPTFTEFTAMQGWDFLIFDAEHGTLQPQDVEELCRAAELRGVTPITRVTTNEPHIILRFLDTGVHGLHVPWVNTAAAAEQAVRSVKYEPRGQRGLAGSRASDWGMYESIAAYTERANRETLVVVQIETLDAVNAVEEYVAIDGIDVLFIGPTDLSHSLGHPGGHSHPEVVEAMDRVAEVVVPSDKALGIYVATPAAARSWLDKGARYIATGTDGFIKTGMQDYLSQVRDPRS
jgi:2-keto-3-deoxy-L-rhamnonate aldolase RhmA